MQGIYQGGLGKGHIAGIPRVSFGGSHENS